MTRSVTFNGQTQFRPGGITRITPSPLTPVGPTATGIVALLGEAEGGEPNSVIAVDEPVLAADIFRSGAIPDAVRIAFDPSNDPRVPSGATRCLLYKTNNSTQSSTQLPSDEILIADTAAGGSTTTVINLTAGGLVVDAHIGRFLRLDNTGELRRIVDNDAATITVSPGFDAAPLGADPVSIMASSMILMSRDWGAHTNSLAVELEPGVTAGTQIFTLSFEDQIEQSPELGGDVLFRLKYLGGPVFDSGTVLSATATTVDLDVAVAPVLNAYAGMILQFDDGTQRLITGNTAADPTVITLAAGHELSAAEQLAVVGQSARVRNVTSATASITGTSGVATDLTSTVAPTADNLAITFIPGETLRQLADRINGTTNYEMTIADGINPDTTLVRELDFGTAATGVDVRFDTAQTAIANAGGFLADLQALIDWVNEFSELATATRAIAGANEGSESPQSTGGVVGTVRDVALFFVGGTRGISSNTDFQNGFDALAQFRVNHIVPLISEDLVNEGFGSTATFASVAAQLVEHVNKMRGVGKNEQGGYIGLDGTREELVAQAKNINNTDVQLFGQKITVLNAAGSLVEQPEWAIAALAAGMRSGVPEVAEPLTFKFMKVNGLTQSTSWDPRDVTDANRLLANGVMFAEQVEGTGFRFVRDLTTHLLNDLTFFIDGNTRDGVRFIAYDLRTGLENRFTGLKATPANAANIRSFVINKMDQYKRENIIVQSLDPETETQLLPGFRNLKVSIRGTVATIRVEIFPVTGIVFQLNDIYLQLPIIEV